MNSLLIAAVFAVTNSTAVLPTVVVEASRLDCPSCDIPAHVEVIDRDDIAASGAANTVELLEKRANLFVRKINSNPAQAQVSMRGYGANGFGRVKMLVDGEELNNADMMPQELLRVPLASVRRVEVLHGPQTVLHGSEASAGVINILSDDETAGNRTEVEARGGSYGTAGAHAGTRGNSAADESGASLGYYADFDFERSDGWRENSWYEFWSAKAGLKQRFDGGSWWALKTFYSNSSYGLPGGLYYCDPRGGWRDRARDADDPSSHARSDVFGFGLSGKLVLTDEQYLSWDLSYRNRQAESYDYLTYDVNTFIGKLKYTWDNEANRLDAGTDLKLDLLDVSGYDSRTRSGGDNDYSRFSGAVFVRDELKFGEQWSLFGGVRGEWFRTRDDYYDHFHAWESSSKTTGEVAGEAGVNWRPVENAKVFARWTRFYHAPLADEMFSAYGVPNLELRPESGHDFELGGEWDFLEDFRFSLTGFHTELDDEIMYMKYANRNADDHTARSGFETSLVWSREGVGSAGILYSYTWARFTEGEFRGNDVPLVPRQLCRVFGEYWLLDWLSVQGGMRFVGEQRYGGDFAAEGGVIPNAVIFDAGLKLKPSSGMFEGFTLAFTVDNLFDRSYFDYGEYFGSRYVYPAAGRSWRISVRYEF